MPISPTDGTGSVPGRSCCFSERNANHTQTLSTPEPTYARLQAGIPVVRGTGNRYSTTATKMSASRHERGVDEMLTGRRGASAGASLEVNAILSHARFCALSRKIL